MGLDMDVGNNRELMQYYSDCQAWLIHLDKETATVIAYTVSAVSWFKAEQESAEPYGNYQGL
jgi:hypothetical protein